MVKGSITKGRKPLTNKLTDRRRHEPMNANPTSELKAMPEPPSEAAVQCSALFSVGDRVTWTHVRQNGSRINFSTREGKVVRADKYACVVKMRNGRQECVRNDRLTKEGETTELTKMFMAMGDESSKPTENNRI